MTQIVSYNSPRLCLGILASLCEYFCQYTPKIAHLQCRACLGTVSQTSSVASKFFIPQINKANWVVRVHEQRQRRPQRSRLFQATGLVNLPVSSSTHGAVQTPVRPKGQCQRAGASIQEPLSCSFTNSPSLRGFRAQAVLCSRFELRSAATLPLGPASSRSKPY